MTTKIASALLVSAALVACKGDSIVNVIDTPEAGVSVAGGYEVDEGATLDLVVDPGTSGATMTTSELPKNASLANGVFTFAPDYTQAGLYTITFTSTAGDNVTEKTVAIRVFNVIHITAPAIAKVSEGAKAADVTFASDDPAGTLVTYSADLSGAPGATFDPVTRTLSFTPSWRWLDANASPAVITVTAEGQELDSGKDRTSRANVVIEVDEATSFGQELVPLFLLPPGSTSGLHPDWESGESHNCLGCHDGSSASPAGIDFHPASIYGELVNHDISANGVNGSTCHAIAATGVKRLVPNDLTKSLWFMKISGTDGANNPGPPCGTQSPEGQAWNYWTVTDQDAWNSCAQVSGENICREALDCPTSGGVTCKLAARLVRKASVWILAGAPNN